MIQSYRERQMEKARFTRCRGKESLSMFIPKLAGLMAHDYLTGTFALLRNRISQSRCSAMSLIS